MKKNLSAKDLSEKFGFKISEADLNPLYNKDSKYTEEAADLSLLKAELEGKLPEQKPVEKPAEKPEEPEKEKTFAELFEEKSKHVDTESKQVSPKKEEKPVSQNKHVVFNDDMDFGKLFNSSSMKIEDKDAIAMPEKDYEPFEMNEEDVEKVKNMEFHGFEDFAKAFGKKGKK